jgi:hypothetical protein
MHPIDTAIIASTAEKGMPRCATLRAIMHIEIGFLVINLRACMHRDQAVGADNATVEYRDLTARGNEMRLITAPWTDANNERLKNVGSRRRICW